MAAPTLFDIVDGHLRPLFDFETPTARATDPQTSHEAAASVRLRAGHTRGRALVALAAAGPCGLTDFELAARTGVPQTSIGVRRKELQRVACVEATDRRRLSPSGTPAIVWQITPLGELEARRLAHEGADR